MILSSSLFTLGPTSCISLQVGDKVIIGTHNTDGLSTTAIYVLVIISPCNNEQTGTLWSMLRSGHTGSCDSLIARVVAIWLVTTDRQCLLRSPFTIARRGLFFTIGCRSYVNLHDNLCTHTFWSAVGRFIVNKLSKRGVDNAWNVTN